MPEILETPVSGRSAWTRSDFDGKHWMWQLDEQDNREIHNAYLQLKERGLKIGEFNAEDFPLPTLAQSLATEREDIIAGKGFLLIRGLDVAPYTVSDLELIYWGIGAHLGSGIEQNANGDLLTHVTFHDLDPANPNVRGYQDRRHQEPHNDLADVVGLLCVRDAKAGGASSIVNMASVYNAFLDRRPDLLPIMYRGFHLDHRGEGDNPLSTTDFTVPIFAYQKGRLHCFYGRRGIDAAFRKRGEEPSADEQAALALMDELIMTPEYRLDMDLQPGDMQFVNNYAVLHARTAYEDYDEPGRWRLLFRLWLNQPDTEPPETMARFTRRGFADFVHRDRAATPVAS